jgi:hypothetical protein
MFWPDQDNNIIHLKLRMYENLNKKLNARNILPAHSNRKYEVLKIFKIPSLKNPHGGMVFFLLSGLPRIRIRIGLVKDA